jgi:lysozyme family protein
MSYFDDALKIILRFEGGWNPTDGGVGSMRGILQTTYNKWREKNGLAIQSVYKIADSEVSSIYKTEYWDKINGDKLPWPLSLAVFNSAVNNGVGGAEYIKSQAEKMSGDPLTNFLNAQRTFYMNIVARNGSQAVFLKGWLARIESIRAYATGASEKPNVTPVKRDPKTARRWPKDGLFAQIIYPGDPHYDEAGPLAPEDQKNVETDQSFWDNPTGPILSFVSEKIAPFIVGFVFLILGGYLLATSSK